MHPGTRTLAVLVVVLLTSFPALARGGFGRRSGGPARPPRMGGPSPRLGTYDPWYPYAPWGYSPYGLGGWGWYGVPYGAYPPAVSRRSSMPWNPPRESESRLVLGGFATERAFHPGISLQVQSDRVGLDVSLQSLSQPTMPDGYPSSVPMLALRGGWAFVHRPSLRVQGELGARGLFGEDYDYFGPDAGVTARWQFAKPFTLRTSLTLMPWPVLALNGEVALGLQVGAGLFELGWRGVRLDDTRVNPDGGVAAFSGFLAGAGLRF
jgi:hypothetical protein